MGVAHKGVSRESSPERRPPRLAPRGTEREEPRLYELDGQVALITGAGRGQGRSHAVALAAAGADVVVTDLCHDIASVPYRMADDDDLAETARLVEKVGGRAMAITSDVRDRALMEGVVEQAVGEFGRIDIVVANAGICGFGEMPLLTAEQWDDMLAVNLTGVFNTFRAVVPHMVERRYGRLVAISSGAGRTGVPHLSHYAATKWAVIGFVKSVALEVAAHGITANVVCPATVDTPMVHNEALYSLFAPDVVSPTKELVQPRYEAMNPMRVAWLDPQEISNAVLFLVSDRSGFISGETIEVSAGGSAQR
jgi:SDR family mycofactocin-dependent oxidoreductase